jgi:hypothetical protein
MPAAVTHTTGGRVFFRKHIEQYTKYFVPRDENHFFVQTVCTWTGIRRDSSKKNKRDGCLPYIFTVRIGCSKSKIKFPGLSGYQYAKIRGTTPRGQDKIR